MPPAADIELENAVLGVAVGNAALSVRAGGAGTMTAIERETDLVCVGLPESVTVAVKLADPVAVGLPEI